MARMLCPDCLIDAVYIDDLGKHCRCCGWREKRCAVCTTPIAQELYRDHNTKRKYCSPECARIARNAQYRNRTKERTVKH